MKPVNFIYYMVACYFRQVVCMTALTICTGYNFAQSSQDERLKYLEESLQINEPKDHRHSISLRVSLQDSTWREWQQRTGELPPDFSQMASDLYLPEPLMWQGKKIETQEEWRLKCNWIRDEYQYWVSGHRPPAPDNIQVEILSDRYENNVHIQLVCLNFGPSQRARMRFELMIPPGNGPFPVYMTQWNHRSWAELALSRGYMACVYAGSDNMDDTENYRHLYPDYDFTCLMRRAWGASRVIDYLVTRPEVDTTKIAITGHSRNGKQSLWAAAFDKRISAVVSSSCGTGGVTPFRFSDPQYCTQTIDDICSNAAHWFQPRLRFFFGREDRLPVDQNLLLSLIAPRSLLIHYSIMERQLSPWATEQCFKSAKDVFSFLGAASHIGILPRFGEHPVATRDLEQCLDFLDIQFHRKKGNWENKCYYTYNFKDWKDRNEAIADTASIRPERLTKHKTAASFEKQKKRIISNLKWLLGEKPASVEATNIGFVPEARMDWIDNIIGRPKIEGVFNWKIGPYTAMNNHLSGYLYCPDTLKHKKIPVIIYLHQYAYAHGGAYGYSSFNTPGNQDLFRKLADSDFAVLSIDMIGFGTRVEEGSYFYERYPRWSLMGKMVDDVLSCVDAIRHFSFLDSQNVFILGNTIGSSVGLISAALDERITGVAALSGFSPWRDEKLHYTLSNFSKQNGFIPRLGLWSEKPLQAPIDFPEIISAIAPRPLLLISPASDKYTNHQLVNEQYIPIESSYHLYGSKASLRLYQPKEINRLTEMMVDSIIPFFKRNSK